MAKKQRPPWRRKNPRTANGKSSQHLSSAQKTNAKRRARRAGRPYPNLVDNMRAAAKSKRRPASKRTKKKRAGR